MTAAFVFVAGSALLLLFLLSAHDDRLARQRWTDALPTAASNAYEELAARWTAEAEAAEFAYSEAAARARAGGQAEALRLLEAGRVFLSEVTNDRRELLRRLSLLSRMISAIAPLPPPRPLQYELRQLAAAAGVGYVVHHFLVTASEQFRWRLAFLRFGLSATVRSLFRSGRRASNSGSLDGEWARIVAARTDWSTLSAEALESFRVLALAVATEPRAAEAARSVTR